MKKRLLLSLLIAIATFLLLRTCHRADARPQGVKRGAVITGLPAGFSTLTAEKQEELERVVLFADPQKDSVCVIGLTDTLGWHNLLPDQWAKADTAVGYRRANAVASLYRSWGWLVEVVGIETQTPYRGVRVEIVRKKALALAVDTVKTVETVETVPTKTVLPDTVEVVKILPAKKSASLFVGGMANENFAIGGVAATLPITESFSVFLGGGMGLFREAIPPQSQFDLWTSEDSRRLNWSHQFQPGGWKRSWNPILIGGIQWSFPKKKGGAK